MRKRRNTPDSRVLGFDGSKGRTRGVADGTALVSIRVEDVAVEVLAHWTQPEDTPGWQIPRHSVEAVLRAALEDERTVGLRTDAAGGWAAYIAGLQNEFLPVLWAPFPMTLGAASWQAKSWDDLYDAIGDGLIAVDFDRFPMLREHLLAARNRGATVGKEHTGPHAAKIDLAAALAYAYRAYIDAKANAPKRTSGKATFI